MKKIILFSVFAVGLILSSCSKDYTCHCITTQDFGDEDPIVSTTTVDFTASSTRKAKEDCETDVSQSIMGMTQTVKCTLK